MLTNKKTKEEIRDLCEQWASDPCWDIEETEGFEALYDRISILERRIILLEKSLNKE